MQRIEKFPGSLPDQAQNLGLLLLERGDERVMRCRPRPGNKIAKQHFPSLLQTYIHTTTAITAAVQYQFSISLPKLLPIWHLIIVTTWQCKVN